ncbi:hypothetical protein JCM10908_000625 [Rhodotorula pacifica]|uniref:Zn(II)2Cys6 transcription factor n=1 Tax=Rhodotorula pacifica TaxID=1495444 RepID=UPI00317D9FD8
MQANDPVPSTSRISDATSSLIAAARAAAAAANHHSAASTQIRSHMTTSPEDSRDSVDRAMSLEGPSDEEGENGSNRGSKEKKRRTRNGCLVCRKRKKLCDEQKPSCGACSRLSLTCEWEDRVQAALERRKRRIERMKLKEKEGGTVSSSVSGQAKVTAKRKASKQSGGSDKAAAAEVARGDGSEWDIGLTGYNPSAPGMYPPASFSATSPSSTSPSTALPPALPSFASTLPPPPATITAAAATLEDPSSAAAALDSPNSWMPFLGTFAPAGYEPAAAPDPLAWSMGSWPLGGLGYSPFPPASGVVGPNMMGAISPMSQYPAIGNAPPPPPLPQPSSGDTDSQDTHQLHRDQIDLDVLARLEGVQSGMLVDASNEQAADPAATVATPNGSSPPFDLFALLRSPSPVHPFSTGGGANTPGVPFAFDGFGNAWAGGMQQGMVSPVRLSAPATTNNHHHQQQQQLQATEKDRGRQLQVGTKSLPTTVGHAASFLASSDWAFTQAYLLSHYTSSLARLVSIASSPSASESSSSGSDRSRSRRGRLSLHQQQQQQAHSRPSSSHSRPRDAATARSTRASANLFLSLVPLANRHPYLLHAILSWSAANLAAASTSGGSGGNANPGTAAGSTTTTSGGNSIMATLSDQLGHLADEEISAALPELEAYAARRANSRSGSAAARSSSDEDDPAPSVWEVLLAARLMLTQAAICQGAVDLWRVRLGEAAHVIDLVGGVQKCRSPLARQLVKNLLYHDVLSSTSRRDGLLLDYSFLRHGGGGAGGTPGSAASGTSPATTGTSATGGGGGTPGSSETEEERRRREAEEDEEDVLDTLMGCAESVFLLVGRITSLAKEKRQALLSSDGGVPEDKLDAFLRQVDDLRSELEREKERMDAFLIERPDLEPHRYFHEVFRLAALVYLEMLLELPPTSYPILLLVRKMLSLTEVIVSEGLPGLCSMHWPLFLMHLNSTPLVSPHAPFAAAPSSPPNTSTSATGTTTATSASQHLSDRQRSTLLFDAHMHEFTFMNTKRSRLLIDEAWRRSEGGGRFVDPDRILDEWEWDLNWA